MDSVEYILRIILRARDEMAAVLRKARLEIEKFDADVTSFNKNLDGLNSRITSLNTRVGNVTKKIEDWRAAMRGFGKDGDQTGRTVQGLAKDVDNFAARSEGALRKTQELRERFGYLRDSYHKLNDEFRSGDRTLGDTVDNLKELGQELRKVQKETVLGDQFRSRVGEVARRVEERQRSLAGRPEDQSKFWKEILDTMVDREKSSSKAITDIHESEAKDRERIAKAESDALLKEQTDYHKQSEQNIKDYNKDVDNLMKDINAAIIAQERNRIAVNKAIEDSEREDSIRRENARQSSLEGIRQAGAKAEERIQRQRLAQEARAAAEEERIAKRAEDMAANIKDVTERWSEYNNKVREGGVELRDQRVALDGFRREFTKIRNDFRAGSRDASFWGAEVDRVTSSIRGIDRAMAEAGHEVSSLSSGFRGGSENVAMFDNKVRGMALLAAAAFAQELLSAVTALGGELVALASSAALAGAALGGAFVAGIGEALPAVGLLAGAISRVKAVTQAFQQNQKLQQAQFTDQEKGAQKAADTTTRLANANDALAKSQEGVVDAQHQLNLAREAGARQLEDLIYQEKQAKLAAEGANLSLTEAQENLRKVIREGGSATDIARARLDVRSARLDVGRSATEAARATQDRQKAGGSVENLENVKAAEKALKDAQDAADKASRGLDLAQDKATRAASTSMTAAANLNFLLSQLSPAERKLYEAFNSIYKDYRRIFIGDHKRDGIYGVITSQFADAVDTVDKILKQGDVQKTLKDMAGSVGSSLGDIRQSFTSRGQVNQFQRITEQGATNLPKATTAIIDLGKGLTNIAEEAGPALGKILDYIDSILGKFVKLTDNRKAMTDFFNEGEKHLEAWANLFGAVFRLLGTLIGLSAGEGKKSVEGLTKTINGWTEGLNKNAPKVRKFFGDAREAAEKIGGVVVSLGKEIFRSFTPERLEKFAKFFSDVVLPAFGKALRFVGELSGIFIKFANTPIGGMVTKFALMGLVVGMLSKSVLGALSGIRDMVKLLGGAGKAIGGIRSGALKASDAVKGMGERMALQKHLGEAEGKAGLLTGTLGKVGPLLTRIGTIGRATALFAFGPWGLLIAAVVAGVFLLLKHFGELGKIWDALKKSFGEMMKDLKPAIDSLLKAFGDIGIKIHSIHDVTKVLMAGLKILADFIAKYIINEIQGFFKVLTGLLVFLIRTISAVIKIIKGVADIFIGAFTGDNEQFKKGLHEILDAFNDLWRAILDGLEKAFEGIVDLMLAPFKAAWDAILSFFGVKSPSKLAEDLGKAILDGLKAGLKGLGHALIDVAKLAWKGFKEVFNAAKDFGEWVVRHYVQGLKNIGHMVADAARWLWDKFKDAFPNVAKFAEGIAKRIVNGLKNLPATMLDAIKGMANDILKVGEAIGGAIWNGIKGAFGDAIDIAKGLSKKVIGFVKGIFGGGGGGDDKPAPAQPRVNASRATDKDMVIPFGADSLKDALALWNKFWANMRDVTSTSTTYIQHQYRDMRLYTAMMMNHMYQDVRGSLSNIQDSFVFRGSKVVDSWTQTWQSIKQVTYDGLNYIGHQTNLALKGLDQSAIHFGLSAPTKANTDTGKASGGVIGNWGERGRDRVLTWLGRGEAVMNWAHQRYVAPAVEAYYGHPFSETFDRVHAYHAGGRGDAIGFAGGRTGDAAIFDGHPSNVAAVIKSLIILMKKHWPLLTVSSTTDHSLLTTSGNVSDHTTGHAVDLTRPFDAAGIAYMNRAANWIKSSGLYKQLKQGIHNPNLAVNAGILQTPPGQFAGAVWAQHANHIHLAMIGALRNVADVLTSVARRSVTGPDGALKTLAQSALDHVRKIANRYISKQISSADAEAGGGQGGGGTPAPPGQHRNWIRTALRLAGVPVTAANVNAQYNLDMGESSGNPKAIQQVHDINSVTGDLAKGIAQVISATFNSYKLPGHGNIFNAIDNIIASVRYQMAKYGHLVGHAGYARGGEIPGMEGTPVGILAHAGEWIVNRFQQSRLAGLLGMSASGLASILGFHGGPVSFAGGGTVQDRVKKIVKQAVGERDVLSEDDYNSLNELFTALAHVSQRIHKVRDLTKKVDPILKIIDQATMDSGLLDQLRASIERRFGIATRRITQQTYKVSGKEGNQRVKKILDDVQIAQKTLDEKQNERETLTDERDLIKRELNQVESQLKRKKLSKAKRASLLAQHNNLQGRLDQADDRVAQNTEDIYAAEDDLKQKRADALQKALDKEQKVIDKINSKFDAQQAQRDRYRRVLTALGQTDLLKSLDDQDIAGLQNRAAELAGQVANLRNIKSPDAQKAADDLVAQIDELNTQIQEKTIQAIQDNITRIGDELSKKTARLDLFSRMADAIGVVGDTLGVALVPGGSAMSRSGVREAKRQADQDALAQYQKQLASLPTVGGVANKAAIDDLTQKIEELNVTIAEDTKAIFDAKVAEVGTRHDYTQSMLDLNLQLVDLDGQISGQVDQAQKESLLRQKQIDIDTKGQELTALLAEATPGTQQYLDLQKAILENTIASKQNTQAINEVTGATNAPQTFSSPLWQQFREAIFNGIGGLLPQYDFTNNGSVSSATGALGGGGSNMASTMSSSSANSTVINQDFTINEAGGPIDTTELAGTVSFGMKTAIQ